MSERIKFTVWRDKWLRGRPNDACLLNENGERCCLGFLGEALGLSESSMRCVADPESVDDDAQGYWPESLLRYADEEESHSKNTELCGDIIAANDGFRADREEALISLFDRAGIDVEFRDGVGP